MISRKNVVLFCKRKEKDLKKIENILVVLGFRKTSDEFIFPENKKYATQVLKLNLQFIIDGKDYYASNGYFFLGLPKDVDIASIFPKGFDIVYMEDHKRNIVGVKIQTFLDLCGFSWEDVIKMMIEEWKDMTTENNDEFMNHQAQDIKERFPDEKSLKMALKPFRL